MASSQERVSPTTDTSVLDAVTLGGFALMVLIGGSNFVFVRLSNRELAPFWGAGLRFISAALIMGALVAVLRLPLPRGRALGGTVLYGAFGIGGFYAFAYWGLVELPAGLAAVIFGSVPLLTLLVAVAHRLERLHWQAMVGALVAVLGIAVMASGAMGGDVRVVSVLAMVAAALCFAEASVVAKRLPAAHPLTTNAIGLTVGAAMLLALSFGVGETQALPTATATWTALAILVLVGSVTLFWLFLFVLGRWTASAVSYQFVLFPLVTLVLGLMILGEPITALSVVGAVIVILGVYFGAFAVRAPTAPKPAGECQPQTID